MAVIRQTKSAILFRMIVVPAMLLCGVFRKPVFQWAAVIAVAIWLVCYLSELFRNRRVRRVRQVNEQQLLTLSDVHPQASSEKDVPENELFLIRQVNYRITEQLKGTYPMVSWLWEKRPSASELCKGGTWRIRVSNADPFNFSEVTLSGSGKLVISMLQVVPLEEPVVAGSSSEDLKSEELLERIDVKTWYLTQGEQVIAQMIDDLNAQGHRQLIVKESGDVFITVSGVEQAVDSILNFPPRLAWEEFRQLLSEDDIEATVMPDGLILAW